MSLSGANDDNHLLIGRALGVTYRREDTTESYVVIPPAFLITDSDGAVFTLGTEYDVHMQFNVLRNDADTGEFAQRIEYRRGQPVMIYGRPYGKKTFSRNRRHFI